MHLPVKSNKRKKARYLHYARPDPGLQPRAKLLPVPFNLPGPGRSKSSRSQGPSLTASAKETLQKIQRNLEFFRVLKCLSRDSHLSLVLVIRAP